MPPSNDNADLELPEEVADKLVELRGEIEEAEKKVASAEDAEATALSNLEDAQGELEEAHAEIELLRRLLELRGVDRLVVEYAIASDDAEQALRAMGVN